MHTPKRNAGFTVIELLMVIVIIIILGALVAVTASGVRAKNRNADRQAAINAIQGQLEIYYAQTNRYPTLAELNTQTWRAEYLKNLNEKWLKDPRWSKDGSCSQDQKPVFSIKAAVGCYSYQVSASDGGFCDNGAAACAHYTLTAGLEGGEQYVKSSLN
jgi:type II secretory pathway pseudopilin PulG